MKNPGCSPSRLLADLFQTGLFCGGLLVAVSVSAQTVTVPASWAYPVGSGDATKPGFAGKVHQLRANAFISTSVSTADAQLAGELIDPATGQPYINMVVTNGNPIIGAGWVGTRPADAGGGPGDARTFTETNIVNYSIADGTGAVVDEGNFTTAEGYPDTLFPGLPGSTDINFATYDNAVEVAVEVIGWIELPAGLQQIGVNCDDGFQLAISPNNAKDLFRQGLISFEQNRNAADSTATLLVETAGVYSFRLIYRAFRDSLPNQLEWFRYDPTNPTRRVLINDKVAGAVKSYRAVTVPTRPYVKSVSPAVGASGVLPTAPIKVVLVNLGTNTPVLKVRGATVAYTSVTNGDEVTLTYTPPSPLAGGTLVNCEVTYAGVTGQWNFVVRTGTKALFIVNSSPPNNSESLIGTRLATKYSLDVEYLTSAYPQANPTDLSIVSNKVLVVVSSSIASGNVATWARNFVTAGVPVPVMTWEYGNGDDWAMSNDGGNGTTGNQTALTITGAPHPLAAGLANGVHTTQTSGNQSYLSTVPEGAVLIAADEAGTVPRIIGIPAGLVVDPTVIGVPITHASRKVYFGVIQNDNFATLNANGLALFDAAVEWLLPPVRPVLKATAGPGAGQMTLSWTGVGTLQTANSLTAPTWTNAANQSNPQAVPATSTQSYFRIRQ